MSECSFLPAPAGMECLVFSGRSRGMNEHARGCDCKLTSLNFWKQTCGLLLLKTMFMRGNKIWNQFWDFSRCRILLIEGNIYQV